jgi:hypothetical protein
MPVTVGEPVGVDGLGLADGLELLPHAPNINVRVMRPTPAIALGKTPRMNGSFDPSPLREIVEKPKEEGRSPGGPALLLLLSICSTGIAGYGFTCVI